MDGVLAIDKPAGWTSHDVVAKVRRLLHIKRVGHTGTLDPAVTGVLPVCIGKATRIVEYLQDLPKAYEVRMRIGYATDTEDAGGSITEKVSSVDISQSQLNHALQSFIGEIDQIPPMYSAVKVKGRKLYELAREGKEIERAARTVTIHSLDLLQLDLDADYPLLQFAVRCSKGTYIRTLCKQIGEQLGYPAVMEHLVRIQSGPFGLQDCVSLEQLEQRIQDGTMEQILVPVGEAVRQFPQVILKDAQKLSAAQGKSLSIEYITGSPPSDSGLCRLFTEDGTFVGIFSHDLERMLLSPEKVFILPNQEGKKSR